MSAYLGGEGASPGQQQITPSPAMWNSALSPSVHSTQEKGQGHHPWEMPQQTFKSQVLWKAAWVWIQGHRL